MKLNSVGLKLCAVYIAYAALMMTLASFQAGAHGRAILLSLVWLPLGLTFKIFYLFPFMDRHPWMNTWYFVLPACLAIVYLIGCATTAVKRALEWYSSDT